MPVVDENNQVVGVANLEDLGYIAVKQKKKAFTEIIIHKPTLVTKDTSLEAIALQMMETQEDHVFVIDDKQRLIGVISGIDIVKKNLELTASKEQTAHAP